MLRYLRPMNAIFYDRADVKGPVRITRDGYLIADPLVGRANNIQTYRAAELGLTDRAPDSPVRVFRPESEVFAVDSLRSASRLPITLDHPVADGVGVMVDATNWREFAKGETGEEILRDGEFIRVPIRITDAGAVTSVQADRREFSLGYRAEIVVGDGSHEGQAYDASLVNIRYNHLAACRVARGGPELRIVDERTPALIGDSTMPKIIIVDGVPADVSNPDVAETLVTRAIAARDTATSALQASQEAVTARDATIAERDATIATLRDELAKATPTPAALRDAAASYARTAKSAAALGVTVTDEMDEAAIRAATVRAKMGDAAKGYTDAQNDAAFAVLAATVADGKAPAAPFVDSVADVFAAGPVANIADASKAFADARNARLDRLANGHQAKAAA